MSSNDGPKEGGTTGEKYGRLDGQKPGASSLSRDSGRAVLLSLQDGPKLEEGHQKIFRIAKERIVIGSVVSADVRINDNEVAPIHAVIEQITGPDGQPATMVYDLASDTGVTVDGAPVVTHPLKAGSVLGIGPYRFKFSVSDSSAEPPTQGPRDRVKTAEGRSLFFNPDEDHSPLLLESESQIEEIFDYRPSQKRALEVVMSWRGTIIDVEHFVKESSVTIGTTRGSDFGIPPLLGEGRYAIVKRSGADFVLNLSPQMKGVMQREGRLTSFENIRAASGKSAGVVEIPIGNEEFAKVSVGEVDFYLSYTAAPPRLKRSRLSERDPLFFQIFWLSMVLSGVIIATILSIPVPQQLEAEQIPERIATILYQPEKYSSVKVEREAERVPTQPKPVVDTKPKPIPTPTKTVRIDITPSPQKTQKPLPKQMNVTPVQTPTPKATATQAPQKPKSQPGQRTAQEGAGARVKGKEGTRGQKNARPDTVHQDKATRPSATGGQGSGGGASQVPSIGNVDMLSGATAKITNILGSSSQRLGKGGERLKGFGGFTTQGSGGAAISGDGRGGGGTAEGLGGLADKGTGGGRVGTGKGAAGNGSGIIGGQARVAIRSGGPEEAVVMGSIDANLVEQALLAHRDRFRNCYEREINAEETNLAGRVSTTFVIGSSGRVTQAGLESSSMKYRASGNQGKQPVEKCVLDVIRSIDFPLPRGAGVVQVTYPFKFSPNKR